MSATERLDGWGEIESFLQCTREAIKRRGYPIRRHETGRVFAYPFELLAHERAQTRAYVREHAQTSVSTVS